jgi:hypothetical protein
MRKKARLIAALWSLALAGLALWPSPVGASPEQPDFNFCPSAASTPLDFQTDSQAGVQFSSSILAPVQSSAFRVGVYVNNLGPGSITYIHDPSAGTGAWSVFGGEGMPTAFAGTPFGDDLSIAVWNDGIPLTPRGSTADFNDGFWGGTFAQDIDILGCVFFRNINVTKDRATSHLDLRFRRNLTGEEFTIRVSVHFRP